jgi:predicted DNA-binding transcriptional regulator AlpA
MGTANNDLETLLNEHDVARIAGLSVASVRRWRLLGQGPKYIKLGAALRAAVRYRSKDISAWLESRPTGGGHQTNSEHETEGAR